MKKNYLSFLSIFAALFLVLTSAAVYAEGFIPQQMVCDQGAVHVDDGLPPVMASDSVVNTEISERPCRPDWATSYSGNKQPGVSAAVTCRGNPQAGVIAA